MPRYIAFLRAINIGGHAIKKDQLRRHFEALAIVEGVKQLDLEARAGLHTGECEIMGDKAGGLAVRIGARIMSKAGPSEVLASSIDRDQVCLVSCGERLPSLDG